MTADRKIPKEVAKPARKRMAEMYKRRKDAGFVRRDRWAHPDDWPEIDAMISRISEQRNKRHTTANRTEHENTGRSAAEGAATRPRIA